MHAATKARPKSVSIYLDRIRTPWLRPDDAATGRVCAPVVPSVNTFAASFAADFRKRPAVLFERRGFACERLEGEYRHIYVGRIKFDCKAGATRHLGSDNGGAGPAEWLVDRLSWRGVVLDWPPHALDRFLGAVAVSIVLAGIDVPKS